MRFIHLSKPLNIKQTLFLLIGSTVCWSCFNVKQASALSFTDPGLQNGTINGAFFQEVDNNSAAGSGTINPFLRVQNDPSERGYNTDGALEFDTKGGAWTHSIKLNDIATETLGGIVYRKFILDINEENGQDKSLIDLTKLQIFLGNGPSLTGFTENTGFGSTNSKLVYDLGNNVLNLRDTNSGSGRYDVLAYIRDDLFTSDKAAKPYLYLYSQFQNTGGGFEEWSTEKASTPIPTPSLLLGAIAFGIKSLRKKAEITS